MADTASRDVLKTGFKEGVKQYIEYDIQNRMEYVYEAPADAIDGAPAIVTRYAYAGMSNRVVYMKEYLTAWDTAWETF